jgi:hypothetical protein
MAKHNKGSAALPKESQDDSTRVWADAKPRWLVRLIEATESATCRVPLDADSLLWFHAQTLSGAIQAHQTLRSACRRLGDRLNAAAALVISRRHLVDRLEAVRKAEFTVWFRPGTRCGIELYVRPAADRVASFGESRT